MRNKKNYNNLFDSICITILLFVLLVSCLFILWFGVINPNEGTNPIATLIFSTIVFGVMMTITTFLIIKFCYGYWILLDDSIIYKKLFSRRRQMKLTEINKVELRTIPALILCTYKSEAYIIYSNDTKIVILIAERKKYSELDYELAKYITY